jgi:acyl-coenzyme A synthetase/AMP-(fatty) acid ligase
MFLWELLSDRTALHFPVLQNQRSVVRLTALTHASIFAGQLETLRGRSVLLAVADQLLAGLALIELDGVARRIVLCPPEISAAELTAVAREADADAWVHGDEFPATHALPSLGIRAVELASGSVTRRASHESEWVLTTSGTAGVPKLVLHTLATLTSAFAANGASEPAPLWSTFYDIRRYGGLQIFLRALCGSGLVVGDAGEPPADFLRRAAQAGVTHISGTPSHWRRALMTGSAAQIAPRYVRMSGEIADQGILSSLANAFPTAIVAHAFASTEAGVGFEVRDGRAGFPATLPDTRTSAGVEIDVSSGTLRLRSPGNALRYLGRHAPPLKSADGFVDTGDQLELRDGRYYFVGRSGGVINVGGFKVHPEEVEAVINTHPWVRMARVRARPNPITGAVVVAELVLREGEGAGEPPSQQTVQREVLDLCRDALPAHKVPATLRIVPSLAVAASGKLVRSDA